MQTSSAGLIKIMYTRLFGSELLGATKSNTCYALNNILIVQSKFSLVGGGGGGGGGDEKVKNFGYTISCKFYSNFSLGREVWED